MTRVYSLQIQFLYKNNHFYRPSITKDEVSDHSDNEYLFAEKLGKEGAPCDRIFKECKISILDQFSGIYTPMLDIIRKFSV